jgi:hypothetical protein
LPPLRLQAVVSAEAVGADNASEVFADEAVQVLLAAVGGDPQHRRLFAEGTPERPRLTTQVPAGLVDVERARVPGLLEQLLVNGLERRGGASEDRVDRADRDRAAKQPVHQLDHLPPREAVAHGQGSDRRLKLRAEAAARNTRRQLRADRVAALGTADALQSVLADLDRQRRQLRDLVPSGRTGRLALMRAEDVATVAALWPVVDDLRHPLDREQRASVAGMARLCALLAVRFPRSATLPQPRRIMARR